MLSRICFLVLPISCFDELINLHLSKQEISKQILDNINKELLRDRKVNQWKNTSSVLQWFENLPNKHKCVFIAFDVVEFYHSISETLLKRALDFAINYVSISHDDRRMILQAKQSLLFDRETPIATRTWTSLIYPPCRYLFHGACVDLCDKWKCGQARSFVFDILRKNTCVYCLSVSVTMTKSRSSFM